MSKRTFAVLALALSAACLGAFGLRARTRGPADRGDDRHLRFAYDWPRGSTYRYAFNWRARTDVKTPEPGAAAAAPSAPTDPARTLSGNVDLEGELVLASYGKTGDVYRLAARIDRIPVHALEVLGHDVFSSSGAADDALVGREAVVEMTPSGVVRAVYFEKDAPALFKHVMQGLLDQAQVVVHADGDAAWSARETTPLGRGVASYEVEETAPARVVRKRAAYESVFALPGRAFAPGEESEDGRATITLDPRGVLSSLADDETLSVRRADGAPGQDFASTSRFTFDLREVGAWVPVERDVASLDARRPGEMIGPQDARAQMLAQRIRGLTAEDMKTSLLAYGVTGSLPGKDWLLRASGLLTEHPELCMDMVGLFEHDAMTDRGRAQIAQLLAGTGTPEAQDALRTALESPAARANPLVYRTGIQAFLAVAHPTRQSLAFLAGSFAEARAGGDKHAAALALGAAAGNALRSGDVDVARAHGATLARALADAKKADDKKNLLDAVGNLGLPSDAKKIAAFARDSDEDVRSSAAFALRKIDTDDARQALFGLMSDPSADVEKSAFDALGYQQLGDGDLSSLARVVTSGATLQRSDSSLINLLAAYPKGGEPVRAMLQFMMARNGADNTTMAELRHLLAGTAG